MLKGVLVDPYRRSVRAVEMNASSYLEGVYQIIGARSVDVVYAGNYFGGAGGAFLYVDDEGLFVENLAYTIVGDTPIAGRFVILRDENQHDDEWSPSSVDFSVDDVRNKIQFVTSDVAQSILESRSIAADEAIKKREKMNVARMVEEEVVSYIPQRTCRLRDGSLLIAYAVHDDGMDDPLKDCEGLGKIYRKGESEEDDELMKEALGLDYHWMPLESAIEDSIEKLKKINSIMAESIESNPDTIKQYEALRKLRIIGDEYAVQIQVGSRGSLYISNSGPTCPAFSCKGTDDVVWVPDPSLRKECDRRAKVYSWGFVLKLKNKWQAILDIGIWPYQQESLGLYDNWVDAFMALSAKVEEMGLVADTLDRINVGRDRAAEELASQAIDLHNQWISGECYGVKVVRLIPVSDDPDCDDFELDSEIDACFGIIGDEEAEHFAEQMLAEQIAKIEEAANQA
jgi:hypothetical protein